jgi:SAM-dependent methyltransferase
MTELLINTGERILLEKETPLMIARHFCAYRFAKDYADNKKILDIGCGEGYGTHYLSAAAKEAIGIDYDEGIINYAKSKYIRNNLKFKVFDIKELRNLDSKFDLICSFQVIEHLREPAIFLNNIRDLLTEDGVFICSTPNRLDASPHSDTPHNKFHIKEYLFPEYRRLLEKYFIIEDMRGLKRGGKLNFYRRLKKIGLFNFLPPNIDPVKRFYNRIDDRHFIIVEDKLNTALDFIAVCSRLKAI